MDVKSFLVELLSALAKLDFVKDVDLKAEIGGWWDINYSQLIRQGALAELLIVNCE